MTTLFRYTMSLVLLSFSMQHSLMAMEQDQQGPSLPRSGDIGYLPGQQPSTEFATQAAQEDWRDDVSSQEGTRVVGNVGHVPIVFGPGEVFVGESADSDDRSVEIFGDDEDFFGGYLFDPRGFDDENFFTDSVDDSSLNVSEEEYDLRTPSLSDDDFPQTPPAA